MAGFSQYLVYMMHCWFPNILNGKRCLKKQLTLLRDLEFYDWVLEFLRPNRHLANPFLLRTALNSLKMLYDLSGREKFLSVVLGGNNTLITGLIVLALF